MVEEDIASLWIDEIRVRPYLISDRAFHVSRNMMSTTTWIQKANDPGLEIWEEHAGRARKPVECAFGIRKKRFSVLSRTLNMHHEDIIRKTVRKVGRKEIIVTNVKTQEIKDLANIHAKTFYMKSLRVRLFEFN